MEVLNNIWNAISVPNPTLINIILAFFAVFIEAPLVVSIIKNIFNLSCTRKQFFICISIIASVSVLSLYIIPDPFNVIANYLCVFLTIFITFKMKFLKTLLAAILPTVIFSLAGSLILTPYLNIVDKSYDIVSIIPMYRIPFALCMYTIVFIINFIIKHRNIKINLLEDFDKKNKAMIISNFLFGLFNIIVQIIITVSYVDILPIEFTFLNFISLSAYFSISLFSLNKVMKLVTTTETLVSTTEKLESAESYNETLHILHDNVRGFKHDFNNIVSTIGGYINTNDMEGLKSYYSQLEDDNHKVNNLYLLSPDLINNNGIYNLIIKKYEKASTLNIKVNFTFLLDLTKLHMKIYEFARILGILLDNAIEAANESEEKIINVEFRKDYKNKRNIILIENSYYNKEVDLEKIYEKGVSEKEEHSGIGLWEVREILKRNNNINLFTTKSPSYFRQQLEIYYLEEEEELEENTLDDNNSNSVHTELQDTIDNLKESKNKEVKEIIKESEQKDEIKLQSNATNNLDKIESKDIDDSMTTSKMEPETTNEEVQNNIDNKEKIEI